MNREELIERICPTDATYECGRGDCESNCKKCEVLLKALLDEYDEQIRADAIEEFANKLIEEFDKQRHEYREINDWSASFGMSQAIVIVEQLKEKKQ